jgi:catechol 2,3-dioxygenase-like lactoylglutathione lyase family enzyme
MELTVNTILVAFAGVFLICFMKGAFGGGFSIVGIPLLSVVMDPVTAGGLLAPLFIAMDLFALLYWKPSTWSKPDLALLLPGLIAREGIQKPRRMVDPDGNRVQLVPPGCDGVTQLAVAMGVRSLGEHRRFYGDILGFAEQPWSGGPAFRLGDSLLLLEEDRAATIDPVRQASGWRYITLQIADIDAVHGELLGKGVREGLAPITLGDVARISMIFDPDGNWIELSRRASIVGSLS